MSKLILCSIPLTIKRIVIPVNNIPVNTAIAELILCFTTSVSFSASIFGYFKFTIIPIVSETNGNIIDEIKIINTSIILKLNLINIIISPTTKTGTIIITAVNTLEIIILNEDTGKLFSILNDFPSNEIIELVIEDISDEKQTNPNKITGIYDLICSTEIGISSDIVFIKLSNFILINIQPIKNIANPIAVFITKTGVLANLFNSFFISDLIGKLVLILYLL